MSRKSTALLLIALVAVIVVLGGLVFSDVFSENTETAQPGGEPKEEYHRLANEPYNWSSITKDSSFLTADSPTNIRVNATKDWITSIKGIPLSIHHTRNDTVTLIYQNKSVRLSFSDGSVLNRTQFHGTVVNAGEKVPVVGTNGVTHIPPSMSTGEATIGLTDYLRDGIVFDTPIIVRNNGTYYRFNVSSWSRTRLVDLDVEDPLVEWVKREGLLVKRNDSTVAFLNFSTGEVTEYGEVSPNSFAVDGDGTLIYARNRTYARTPDGSESLLFPDGTNHSYENTTFRLSVRQSDSSKLHVVSATDNVVAIVYPESNGFLYGNQVVALYNRETGEEVFGTYSGVVRLSEEIARMGTTEQYPETDPFYLFSKYNATNGSLSSYSVGPFRPRVSGVAGEFSFISGNISDGWYLGLYKNGTVWHLKVDEEVGTVHELAVSPDRRSVVASNGSAVFKLRTNQRLNRRS